MRECAISSRLPSEYSSPTSSWAKPLASGSSARFDVPATVPSVANRSRSLEKPTVA
jgi:hypothetical protein